MCVSCVAQHSCGGQPSHWERGRGCLASRAHHLQAFLSPHCPRLVRPLRSCRTWEWNAPEERARLTALCEANGGTHATGLADALRTKRSSRLTKGQLIVAARAWGYSSSLWHRHGRASRRRAGEHNGEQKSSPTEPRVSGSIVNDSAERGTARTCASGIATAADEAKVDADAEVCADCAATTSLFGKPTAMHLLGGGYEWARESARDVAPGVSDLLTVEVATPLLFGPAAPRATHMDYMADGTPWDVAAFLGVSQHTKSDHDESFATLLSSMCTQASSEGLALWSALDGASPQHPQWAHGIQVRRRALGYTSACIGTRNSLHGHCDDGCASSLSVFEVLRVADTARACAGSQAADQLRWRKQAAQQNRCVFQVALPAGAWDAKRASVPCPWLYRSRRMEHVQRPYKVRCSAQVLRVVAATCACNRCGPCLFC